MRLFKQQTGINRRAAASSIKKNRIYEKMNSL